MSQVSKLCQYVSFIRSAMGISDSNAYLVLGASGSCFFIELATGPLLSRDILMNIHIKFDDIELNLDACEKAISNKTEIFFNIPDSAHLIALLGLLESAFNCRTTILHPLDYHGDYFPGWTQAVDQMKKIQIPFL